MKIRFETHCFDGERVLQTSPELSNRISSEWYRRPNLYTGRALTADTLISNTKHHLRHLQLSGRHVSRGVIQGLTLSHYLRTYTDGEGTEKTEEWLRLTAGRGITNWGEDVTLPETTDILLDHVTQWESENPPKGAGVFVLQPLEILDEIVSDEDNQCQWDEDSDPFDDEQIVDGCRLVFVPWPAGVLGPIPKVQIRQFRNQLAYQIFNYELAHPDTLLPWESVGIPVGLAYITVSTAKIMFIDRQAVVRQGGAPLSTRPLLTMNGTPFMWEARIQQFVGHLYDIRQIVSEIPNAFAYFDTLPPVGVLPKQAMNFDEMRSDFFPSQFIVEASPIPEEQLEVAMNASAGLLPFDLYQPEKIKLLVPVPQSVFEPDLLKKETPDPIFIETLRKLIREIRRWLANRAYLRNMADRVIGAIDTGKIPEFGDDTDVVPDEETFPVAIFHDGDLTEFGMLATNAVKNLHEWIRKNAANVSETVIVKLLPMNDDPPVFVAAFKGIENFILELKNDIKKTEGLLSSGYVKAEADMYRLRQLLAGNTKASRLATSPALGKVVSGTADQPTTENINAYFKQALTITPGESEAESDITLPADVETEGEKLATALRIMKKLDTGESLTTKEVYQATQVLTSALSGRVGGAKKAVSMVSRPTNVTFEDEDTYTIKEDVTATVKKYRDAVVLSKAVALERDKPLVVRVYESPSMEVKSNAVKTKSSIFESLADMPFDIDDDTLKIKVADSGSNKAILKESTYDAILKNLDDDVLKALLEGRASRTGSWVVVSTAPLTDAEKSGLTDDQIKKVNLILKEIKNEIHVKLKDLDGDLSRQIRDGLLDPDPGDGDEADYFTAGVSSLEHGLNAMRVIEKILEDYKKTVTQSGKVLSDLRSNADAWKDKLGEIDDKLVVLRHDALVTRSLFEEERSRLNAINANRKAILDNYVTSLVFVRPRLVDSRLDVPSVKLYAEYVNPVPACLAEDYEAAGELEDMLDVFREIPLSWLTDARDLVKLVNTTTGVVNLMQQAGARASRVTSPPVTVTASYKTYNTHEYGKAVGKIVSANRQVTQTFAQQKASMDLAGVSAKTWVDLVDQAKTQVSLADLVANGKGSSGLAVKAAAVMENLEDVAVCLNYLVDGLEPAVKLQWANLISIYDKPVDLRYLETLPSFDKIDVITRKDLQNMVDWLFSQVDTSIAQARQTMNDLVRVCILLACHAPVSTIINGYVTAPATGKVGDIIDISVNQGLVRVGMTAAVITRQSIAVQGVVTDVGADAARIKVTGTKDGGADFSIDKGAQVKFTLGAKATLASRGMSAKA
jgi:hypothetical protein